MLRYLKAIKTGISLYVRLIRVGGTTAIRRNDILSDVTKYAEGILSTHRPDPGGLVPIANASGGLLAFTVDLALQWGSGDDWLLVSEPLNSGDAVSKYVFEKYGAKIRVSELESELEATWREMIPEIDLCDPQIELGAIQSKDVVITQALLEHVVDPVQVIKALIALLKPGGVLVVQTCNPFITFHRSSRDDDKRLSWTIVVWFSRRVRKDIVITLRL